MACDTVAPRRRGLWKHTLAHVVRKILRSTEDQFPELCVLFHERRHERIEESENIVTDQHLTVAVRPRPDTNRGNLQPGSHSVGNRIWNRLEYDRKCSRVFESPRVSESPIRRLCIDTAQWQC
jgi:type IV secretory pathway VirB4 component